MSSTKYLLFLAYALFAATGLTILYVASYLLLRTVAYFSPWLPQWMWFADVGLYVHAVAVAATSCSAIIGVFANKAHALKLYTYILFGLMLVEVVLTVQLATRRSVLDTTLSDFMLKSMESSEMMYGRDMGQTLQWDGIQLQENCCGAKSYKDWFVTPFGNATSVPDSCCLLVAKGCGHNIVDHPEPEDEIITEGCQPNIMDRIRMDFDYLAFSLWLPALGAQTILIVIIAYLLRRLRAPPIFYPYVLSASGLLIKGDFKNPDSGYQYLKIDQGKDVY